MMVKRVLALVSALLLFHLFNALGDPVFPYLQKKIYCIRALVLSGSQRTQCMVGISGSCLEMGMRVFMYLTRFAFFICVAVSMKPSVESGKGMLVRALEFLGSFSAKALNYFSTERQRQNIMCGE